MTQAVAERTCPRCGGAVEDAGLCVDCHDGRRPLRPCAQCGRPTRRGVSHSKACTRLAHNARQAGYKQRRKADLAARALTPSLGRHPGLPATPSREAVTA